MLITPSGIIDIANGLVVTSISLHSAWPGTDGADNELSGGGYARQSISFPAAVTSPTRTYTSATTWSVPANSTVAFYGLWNGSTFKAMAANGGSEKEVRRILTTGAIWCPNHGLAVGNRVAILGDWPSPFTEGELYYVRSATPNTIALSATPTGSALAPATANYNTNMVLSKIELQVFGGAGTFTLTGMDLRWKWTDAGPVVNPEPTGFRWTSTRPIPPQEIVIGANEVVDVLQYLTGGEPTSVKIITNEAQLNALGITYNEQQAAWIAGPTLTAGSVDVVMRASNDLIVDYEGQEFFFRIWTSRELMLRDDVGGHSNTGYRASEYWNESSPVDSVTSVGWNSPNNIGLEWKTRGGDYDPTAIGSFTTAATSYPEGTTFTINALTAVKAIADGRFHYGFIIRPGTSNNGRHDFHAREATNSAYRPKLTINGIDLVPESDQTIDTSTKNPDTTALLSLAGRDGLATGELKTAVMWFGFDTFFSDNAITSGSQVTSATLTLTLQRTRTAGISTYILYHLFNPADISIPEVKPVGIGWKGAPTGDPAHPTVGLRYENLRYHRDIHWFEDWSTYPDTGMWDDFRIQNMTTVANNVHPKFDPKCRGDLIEGNDSQHPSIGTMTAMYPGMKSLRMYWQGLNSPVGHCETEASISLAKPANNLWNWFKVQSIAADGLITLTDTFTDRTGFKYGNFPFGDKNEYPRGYQPVYILPGAQMPLPGGYPVHQTKTVVISGVSLTVPIGPPLYCMAVQSPGTNNKFYLSLTPFGDPIVPTSTITAGTYPNETDYIRVSAARRLGVTPMAADINPLAKNQDGTFRFKKSSALVTAGQGRGYDEMYFGGYYYLPDTYKQYMQSAKQFMGGVDFQYPDQFIRGMGYGNGGSSGDGFGGTTIRGHANLNAMIPLGERGVQWELYTYLWHPDINLRSGYYDLFLNLGSITSDTGGIKTANKLMVGFVEFNRWYHFEWYAKPNSLVPNTAPVFIGDNVTPNYNCVIDGVVQPCPTGYACYNPIHAIPDNSIDPATGKARNPFGGPYPNTFRSPIGLPATWENGAVPFKYSYVDAASKTWTYELFSPSGRSFWGPKNSQFTIESASTDKSFRRACIERVPTRMWIDPNTNKSDGKYELRINGRTAIEFEGFGSRHVDVCKDGVTPLKIWGPLMTCQVGGVDKDFYECFSYIGPLHSASTWVGPMALS